jgi:hypothetical protein
MRSYLPAIDPDFALSDVVFVQDDSWMCDIGAFN